MLKSRAGVSSIFEDDDRCPDESQCIENIETLFRRPVVPTRAGSIVSSGSRPWPTRPDTSAASYSWAL